MISAHARAGLLLKNQNYIDRAGKAAQFILKNLYKKGRLLRSYKDGTAKHNAYLPDYAFFISGLLDIFEATSEPVWLNRAIELDGVLEKHYEDKEKGGFFMTSNDHETLLVREKPRYDGAEPTGNSVQALNLLRLAELTTKKSYHQRALKTLKAFSGILTKNPNALTEMLSAVDFYYDQVKEIIIVTPPGKKEEAETFLKIFRKKFLPNCLLIVASEGEHLKALTKIVPLVENKLPLKGKATAYVCEKGICQLPTNDPLVFSRQINKTVPL